MKLPGIVTNVTNFGAFVDVGVHQDGLVHISQLADKYVSDPAEVVKVGQKVNVTVTEVDLNRNRIALSMRSKPEPARAKDKAAESERQTMAHAVTIRAVVTVIKEVETVVEETIPLAVTGLIRL